MISGARKSKPNFFTRLLAKGMSRELSVFPVPGEDVFSAEGIDLESLDLTISNTPRHANLLMLFGNLPEDLRKKAAVAYAQMPRPRALWLIDGDEYAPLPEPVIRSGTSQADLENDLKEIRDKIKSGSWSADAEAYQPDFLTEDEHKDHHGHGGHDHGGHNHGGDDGGMMSMEMMTMDLPRSADGLPMDWSEVHFGPFHPGLPGGLDLHLKLDGDTVGKVLGIAGVNPSVPDNPEDPKKFSRLFPLEHRAYRCLAEAAFGQLSTPSKELERERILSHLRWLRSFAELLGNNWLQRQANQFYFQLSDKGTSELPSLKAGLQRFFNKINRLPLIRYKLKGKGQIPETDLEKISGPVARAAGVTRDLRTEIQVYRERGFEPVSLKGNDAYTRLQVRLKEIIQSLELIEKLGEAEAGDSGSAVETARGQAVLHPYENEKDPLVFEHPSTQLAELIPGLIEGHEIADALLIVSSLDISPWQLQKITWK